MQYFIIVTVSSLIGYITNWVALKMLFHPKKPKFGLQGIMIKRKAAIAASIADLIIDRLLSNELSGSSESMINNISDAASSELAILLAQDMSLDPSETIKIQSVIANEIANLCKNANIKTHAAELKDSLIKNINAIPDDEIESVVLTIVANEFKTIEIIGAVLGAVIGGLSCLSL